MPRVPDHVVQEIKDRVSIREVVEDYVQLKKDGANYKGLCPFHQEKTPSFKVNESRGIFKCFGCGESGNIYGFLMKIEGMSFPEAMEKLAGRAGIALPRVEERPEEKQKREKSDLVFQANQAAATFYNEQLLRSAAAESARAYLQKREIGAETINRRRLGYAPDSWTDTLEAMKRSGIKEQDLQDAGLVIRHEEKGSLYDRFRGRLMFPIVDQRSRVRGFGARILAADPGQPKYINSPETAVFRKGSGFYGLDIAKDPIRKRGRILIVEGYFDQITLDQAGIDDTVATLGTALTAEHATAIRRLGAQAFLVFDADEAGRKASLRALEVFLDAGLSPQIVLIPAGDPDDFVREKGREAFERLLEQAPSLLTYYLDLQLKEAGPTPTDLAAAVNRAAEMVARVQDPVERSLFADQLAQRSGVALPQIAARLRRPEKRRPEEAALAAAPSLPPGELDLLRLLLHHPECSGEVRASAVMEKFSHTGLSEFLGLMLSQEEREGKMDAGSLLHLISDPGLVTRITHVIFEPDPFAGIADRALRDIVRQVRQEHLLGRIRSLSRRLSEAQAAGDEGQWRRLLEEQQRLEAERRELFSGRAGG